MKTFGKFGSLRSQTQSETEADDCGSARTVRHSQPQQEIRVALLADEKKDHLLLRQALKLMAEDWTLESYLSSAEALTRIRLAPPRVVLMAVSAPSISRIDCMRRLKTLLPNLPIVIVSERTDPENLLNSMIAGACGYLIKPVSPLEMMLALKRALAGSFALCPRAEKVLTHALHRLGKKPLPEPLLRQEQKVTRNSLRETRNWLELAQQVKWSVVKFAKECNVSVRTLERYFLKEIGKGPQVWLCEQRQHQAIQLLRSGCTVKETAELLGYKHATHFSRQFREHWGHSPTTRIPAPQPTGVGMS